LTLLLAHGDTASYMRILSLDSLLAAYLDVRLIAALEERRPGFLARVDLVAGASESSQFAFYLAANLGSDDRANLGVARRCVELGNDYLRAQAMHVTSVITLLCSGSLVSRRAVDRVFGRYLGDETLGDLEARGAKKAMVVGLDAVRMRPEIFRSFDLEGTGMARTTLANASLCSTTLPMVMPPNAPYLDSSSIAMSPAMSAVAVALRSAAPGDVSLLSLGAHDDMYVEGGAFHAPNTHHLRTLIARTVADLALSIRLPATLPVPTLYTQLSSYVALAELASMECAAALGAGFHRLAPDLMLMRAVAVWAVDNLLGGDSELLISYLDQRAREVIDDPGGPFARLVSGPWLDRRWFAAEPPASRA